MNTDQPILDKIENNPLPLVVDVWAPWCGPCRAMGPVLEKLSAEYEGRVDVLKVNADEHPALVQRWQVRGIPTLLLFKEGREKSRLIGMQGRPTMNEFFEFALHGQGELKQSIAPLERILRLAAGLVLAGTGFALNTWWLAGVGFVLMFLAVYDRCPVWQFLTSKLAGRKA
jgi:thioredoxin 1